MLYSCVPSHFACTCAGTRARVSARGSRCRSGRGATPPRGGSATQGLVDERAGAWARLSIHGFRNFSRRAFRTGFWSPGRPRIGAGGPRGAKGPESGFPPAGTPRAAPSPGNGPWAPDVPRSERCLPWPSFPPPGGPPARGAGRSSAPAGGGRFPDAARLPAEAGPPGSSRREDPLPGLRPAGPRPGPPGAPARPVRRLRRCPGPLAASPGHRHPGQPDPGGLGGAGPGGGVEARRVAVSPDGRRRDGIHYYQIGRREGPRGRPPLALARERGAGRPGRGRLGRGARPSGAGTPGAPSGSPSGPAVRPAPAPTFPGRRSWPSAGGSTAGASTGPQRRLRRAPPR